jgi:hypothetical protein
MYNLGTSQRNMGTSFSTPTTETVPSGPTTQSPNNSFTDSTNFNTYATWSVTLYMAYKAKIFNDSNYNAVKDYPLCYEYNNTLGFLGEDSGVDRYNLLSLDDFLVYLINATGGIILTPNDFKNMDLGGKDQAELRSGNKSFDGLTKPIYIATSGTIETRNSNIKSYYFSILQKETNPRSKIYALLPEAETQFTGLSIANHVKTIYNGKNTLIIPVGSTDIHLIYINKTGDIKFENVLNFNNIGDTELSEAVTEKISKLLGRDIPDTLVFAGSFIFGLDSDKFKDSWGIEPTDINTEKGMFDKISPITGSAMMAKIKATCTNGGNKLSLTGDQFGKFDFSCITNTKPKGVELCKFMDIVFNNSYMSHILKSGNPEMVFFARKSPKDVIDAEITSVMADLK